MKTPRSGDPRRPHLKKVIGGWGFFSLAFGSMIGVGWITALGSWFEQAGPGGAIVAFAAGGALMLVIGLCYAEVTPMLPVTGGEVAYAYKAYGTRQAFVIGWFLAFGYLSVSAGSLGILLVMLYPGSPGMLVWPLEWMILAALSAGGVWFWIAGRRYREQITDPERARQILEEYAE